MPSFARKQIIEPDQVSFYHLISRCVRRAFLCGVDKYTSQSFEHRRAWIEERIKMLGEKVYFIEIFSYAILSNHFHLAVRTRPDLATIATDAEIIERWWNLFPRKVRGGYPENPPEYLVKLWLNDPQWIEVRRKRLSSISWLMASITEYIARRANKEDGVTGRFWEGRFKSQILLDEKAVLSAATYVDLNPIRANMCDQLATSDYTSIQKRLADLTLDSQSPNSKFLAKFYQNYTDLSQEAPCLSIDPKDYVDICAWKASQIVNARKFAIVENESKFDIYTDEIIKKSKFALGKACDLIKFAKKRNVERPAFLY